MMDIQLISICKRYGQHQVLQNFSATFQEGRASCLMGPSGCGKTTVLRLLLGLEQADSGTILGAAVPKAAVFQENRLFEDFSPISNVAAVLPRSVSRDFIAAQLASLGLRSHLTEPARSLSGGMKRRVALARAMLAPASLVLLDEPFTGLDEDSKEQALSFIKANAEGKTLILVTHDASDGAYFAASTLSLSPTT